MISAKRAGARGGRPQRARSRSTSSTSAPAAPSRSSRFPACRSRWRPPASWNRRSAAPAADAARATRAGSGAPARNARASCARGSYQVATAARQTPRRRSPATRAGRATGAPAARSRAAARSSASARASPSHRSPQSRARTPPCVARRKSRARASASETRAVGARPAGPGSACASRRASPSGSSRPRRSASPQRSGAASTRQPPRRSARSSTARPSGAAHRSEPPVGRAPQELRPAATAPSDIGRYASCALPPERRRAIAVCLNPLASPPRADRILIVRLGAVGDVARTLPAASCLRAAWPGAHLAWLVEAPAAGLVASQAWVDEAIVFPRPSLGRLGGGRAGGLRDLAGFLGRLRARRFDLVVDFHSILRSALLALATGARRRVGYARPFGRELAWLLATHRARVVPTRVSRFERNEALVRFLGAPARFATRPLRVDPAALAAMRARLGDGPAPLAIHPGTSDGARHKRVPAEVLACAARVLHAELGVSAVVTHGPARDDLRLAEAVVAGAGGAARLAPPTPRLARPAAPLACPAPGFGPGTRPAHRPAPRRAPGG